MRISLYPALQFFQSVRKNIPQLPLVSGAIAAGFPSPAADFEENQLDLNSYLIKNKSATFFARTVGESMKNSGISDGDIIVVDKSLQPQQNDIAVCYLNGEFTVKRITIDSDIIWLMPENETFEPIKTTIDDNLIIWGVVTGVIKKLR